MSRASGPSSAGGAPSSIASLAGAMVEAIGQSVIATQPDGTVVFWNGAAERLFGWSASEASGRDVRELLLPQSARSAPSRTLESLRMGATTARELLLQRRDGSVFPGLVVTSPVRGPDGSIAALVGVTTDLTELRAAENRLRTVIERSPDGMAVIRCGKLILANPALAEMLGVANADHLLGQHCQDLLTGCQPDGRDFDLDESMVPTSRVARVGEYGLRTSSQGPRTCEVTSIPIDFDGKPAGLAIFRDVTQRKQMEARLLFADRMASVGTLAAGVAHELNNPLAYLLSNLEYLNDELDAALRDPAAELRSRLARWREAVSEAREGGQRMRVIIRDLRAFARMDDDLRKPMDLARVVEQAIHMCTNEIRHRARLEVHLSQVPKVMGNEARLGQVVLNLLVNAAQAIPEGQIERNRVDVGLRSTPDGWVLLEVRDTGVGIPSQLLPRVFDPFFSTKPVGVGTGLGLSICHSIVAGLGGRIEIESEVGQGTALRVLLRVAEDGESQGSPLSAAAERAKVLARRPRVLAIDDEQGLLSALKRLLGSDCEVLEERSARSALSRLVAGERFDLILCDLMMPEMSGMDLHAELSRQMPELARSLVFMTGGGFTPAAVDFLARVDNVRMEKPFDRAQVRKLLAERMGTTT